MNKNIALLYGLCLMGLFIACQKSFSSGKSLPQSSAGSMEARKSDEEEIKRMIVAREEVFAAGKCEQFESYVTPDVLEIEGGLATPHEVKSAGEGTRSRISNKNHSDPTFSFGFWVTSRS
jgi:hypothetical protein